MARTILNILPTEILIQICLYLSRDELKALHRTNSTFHKLLASNEFWQAKIVYCLGQEGRSYALAIRQDPAFSLFTWDMVFLALFEQWKFSFEHGLAGWDFKYLGRRLNVRKNPLSTTHETSLDAIHPQLKQFHVARHIRLAPGTYRLQVHFSQRNPSQARHPNMGKRPSFENLRFNVYLYDDDLPHKTIIEPPRQSRLLNNPEFPRKLISSTALDSASSDLLVAKSWNAFVPIQVAEFYVTRGRHEMREWRTVLVEIAEDEGGDDDEKAPMVSYIVFILSAEIRKCLTIIRVLMSWNSFTLLIVITFSPLSFFQKHFPLSPRLHVNEAGHCHLYISEVSARLRV